MSLLADINRFTAAHGMSDSKFGRLAINDGRLLARLRRGAELRPATEARIRAYMAGAHKGQP